jgi:Tfp pilus assembly protein FimV
MTAAWLAPDPANGLDPPGHPRLRLVPGGTAVEPRVPTRRPAGARQAPLEVRRRRTLVAAMALMLLGLALPLSGTGGHSHATGPAPAGATGPVTYTVRPGDTLWSIAQRADPNGDPRPLVARLAAEDGSDQVVPGQQLEVP